MKIYRNIPVDMVDFGSSIAMDELKLPERKAFKNPKASFLLPKAPK